MSKGAGLSQTGINSHCVSQAVSNLACHKAPAWVEVAVNKFGAVKHTLWRCEGI